VPETLSLAAARRIALRAQGFGTTLPRGGASSRAILTGIERLNLLQLDSVNVVTRSHYLPLFARLGGYDRARLDDLADRRHLLYESWAHEASLLPVQLQPLLRWQYAWFEQRWHRWIGPLLAERPGYVEQVLAEVAARGPLTAGELDDTGDRSSPWWGYSAGKRALEWLFATGRVMAYRRTGFTRVYDLPERVLPAEVLALPTPDEQDAKRELLRRSARALGVATADDLLDYFRLHAPTSRHLLADLVEDGTLLPVTVAGWAKPAFLHAGATTPRRVAARALLAPFDPVVWHRARAERLWGFHYRISIYTPAAQREHGYYVMPFLLGDDLVARVDVKADRKAGVLRIPAAFAEPHVGWADIADDLHAACTDLATWLGLPDVAFPIRPGRASPA
jgi:uncharacterized protein